MRGIGLFGIGLMFLLPAWPQQRVDSGNLYHRYLAVVPLVGAGTGEDPKRPMFAPLPAAAAAPGVAPGVAPGAAPDRSGILAYQRLAISDDGTLALVEFVAANKAAFSPLVTATDPRVIAFEVGKHTRAEIEAAFKRFKASFSFDNFRPLRVQ